MQAVATGWKASSTGQVQSRQAKPPLAPKPLDDLLSVQHEHESPTPIVVFPRADGRAAADGECNSACSPVRMHRRLDRTRAERRRRARYRVNPSANNDLHDTSSLLQSCRRATQARWACPGLRGSGSDRLTSVVAHCASRPRRRLRQPVPMRSPLRRSGMLVGPAAAN